MLLVYLMLVVSGLLIINPEYSAGNGILVSMFELANGTNCEGIYGLMTVL